MRDMEYPDTDLRVQRVAQVLATTDPLREHHRGAGPWQPPRVRDYHRDIARMILKALGAPPLAALADLVEAHREEYDQLVESERVLRALR